MFTFSSFRLDPRRRQLFKDGELVPLPAKAVDTLTLLVREHGRVVEKDEILSAVWPDAFVSEDSLTHVISLLRRAFGDDAGNPLFIATVPRRGYRFLAAVSELPDLEEPTPAARETSVWRWATRPGLWKAAAWVVPAALALALIARTVSVEPRGGQTGAPIRFLQTAPPGTTLSSGGVLSPDGRHLAFVALDRESGRDELWVRALDATTPRAIAGTEGAYRPFWSPDSTAIGFFADGKLKRVGVSGIGSQTLAPVGYRPSGGSWSSRGVILYADRLSRLFSVPENGGTPAPVTSLDQALGEFGHHTPQFLPDGDHFLFSASSTNPVNNVTYVASLSSSGRVRVLDSGALNAIYAPPGYLLYVRDNVLMAQRFDAEALRTTGSATRVPTVNAAQDEGEPRVGVLSASTNGLLTFGGDRPRNHLAWYSREGRALGLINAPDNVHNPVMGPDDRTLVADGGSQGGIWLVDLERGAPTRIVDDGHLSSLSPDGSRVSYTTRRIAGATDIYLRSVGGADDEALLIRTDEMKLSGNWSPDSRYFTYVSSNPETRLDLWVLDTQHGSRAPHAFLTSPSNEMQPQVSPDGRWLAYASDESGTWEVYVQSFPAPGRKRTLSVGGGAQPEWRRDGRELFYLSLDGTLMAIDVTTGETFEAGRPRPLFGPPVSADVISYRNQYTVSSNGQRFVVDAAGERDPIHIVVNWNTLVNP